MICKLPHNDEFFQIYVGEKGCTEAQLAAIGQPNAYSFLRILFIEQSRYLFTENLQDI